MVYFCNLCNYTATSSSGFSHHKKTQKHTKLAQLKDNASCKSDVKISPKSTSTSCKLAEVVEVEVVEKINSKFIQSLQCSNCKIIFKHKSSLSRHTKLCKILNDNQIIKKNFDLEKELMEKDYKLKIAEKEYKLILAEKECKINLAEKEVEIIKKLEKEKSELLTNFMSNANNLLNKAHDNTKITTEAMKSVSMSALKYANEKFKDTPALIPIKNFNINNLDFEKEEDKKQLVELLIYYAKKKSLDKLLGDHIVNNYKKENLSEQPFHVTDCSRLNYIVRELIENALTWSIDKNGIKICSSIIKPLINKCITPLLEYQKTLLDIMSTGDYSKQPEVEIIIIIVMSIDSGSLENEINKYIAPYFNLDKHKLKEL